MILSQPGGVRGAACTAAVRAASVSVTAALAATLALPSPLPNLAALAAVALLARPSSAAQFVLDPFALRAETRTAD